MIDAKRASLQRRLKRRELWAGLWLVRIIALLQHFCGEPRVGPWRDWFDATLNRLARCVMAIVLCRAALRVELRAPRGFADPRKSDRISLRAAYGGALRRAFKAKGLKERLEKIRRALDAREALIARLARRLRRGMTRLAFAHTRAPIAADAALLLMRRAAAIRLADTS